MKKLLILLSFTALLFSSCALFGPVSQEVRERKAQKKLRKAIAWDSSIVQRQYLDTHITGFIDAPVEWTTPEIILEGPAMNTDSLLRIIKKMSLSRDSLGNALYLYQDSLLTVQAKFDKHGNLIVSTNIAPQKGRDTVRVPYDVPVRVPGKLVKQVVKAPLYTYFWFWVVVAVCLLCLVLFIREATKSRGVNIQLKTGDNAEGINKQS